MNAWYFLNIRTCSIIVSENKDVKQSDKFCDLKFIRTNAREVRMHFNAYHISFLRSYLKYFLTIYPKINHSDCLKKKKAND